MPYQIPSQRTSLPTSLAGPAGHRRPGLAATTRPPHPSGPDRAAEARWRVAIVEDHTLQRRRSENLFAGQRGMRVVWSGETLPQFASWLEQVEPGEQPHLLLLDLLVDGGPGADPDVVRALHRRGVRVLVFSSASAPQLVRAMLRAGVAGVVGKRDSERDLVAAAWTVLGGRRWYSATLDDLIAPAADRPRLSDQEERMLVLYAAGETLAACAKSLGVQPETAKKYLTRVKAKYLAVGRPVRSKVDLHRVAVQDGYLDVGSSYSVASTGA